MGRPEAGKREDQREKKEIKRHLILATVPAGGDAISLKPFKVYCKYSRQAGRRTTKGRS